MLAGNKHVVLAQKIKKLISRLDEDGPEDKEKQKLDFLCPSRIARPSRNPVALRDSVTPRVARSVWRNLSRYATGLRIQFFEFNMGKRLDTQEHSIWDDQRRPWRRLEARERDWSRS
ncbi:hypothetical protein E3N88_15010 [Mikania micrantha]|uniref:Uncharacterized protein n=1 Tax=Mikania micrantha TaxID=192012 RepID=A0A5N6P332_9ASTR|nr:hypothetical protein E3N88_15010 [Mikania micrantha]